VNNTNLNNEEDRRLVNRVLNGDTQVFGHIIKNTEKLVAQIVFKMISRIEDRKDVAQDIYLKAWNKLPSFRFDCRLSTWIAQIGYHACIDYLRKEKRLLLETDHEKKEPGETEGIFPVLLSNYTAAEHDTVTKKELSTILKEEIEKLPPVYRTMIALYHQEELSYDEIGQVTGLPAGTVKSYLFRARRTLKNNLLANYKKDDL
jgi:RNA polymerase sigma-70 factor (ECF subfamily)